MRAIALAWVPSTKIRLPAAISRAAVVTSPMLRNDAASTIMARASRRLRAPALTGPLLWILDQFEIGIVRQPENAADDFCSRKSHGVTEQPSL